MINLILKEMSTAFKPLAEVEFISERMESNPSLVTIAYPTDTAILFKIDVEMDSRGGGIEVLIRAKNPEGSEGPGAKVVFE